MDFGFADLLAGPCDLGEVLAALSGDLGIRALQPQRLRLGHQAACDQIFLRLQLLANEVDLPRRAFDLRFGAFDLLHQLLDALAQDVPSRRVGRASSVEDLLLRLNHAPDL